MDKRMEAEHGLDQKVSGIIALLVAHHCFEAHNSAGPAKDPWLMNLMDRFEVEYKKNG